MDLHSCLQSPKILDKSDNYSYFSFFKKLYLELMNNALNSDKKNKFIDGLINY